MQLELQGAELGLGNWPVAPRWWWRTPWRSTGCTRSEDRAKSIKRRAWPHEIKSYCPGTSTAWTHVFVKRKEEEKNNNKMSWLYPQPQIKQQFVNIHPLSTNWTHRFMVSATLPTTSLTLVNSFRLILWHSTLFSKDDRHTHTLSLLITFFCLWVTYLLLQSFPVRRKRSLRVCWLK